MKKPSIVAGDILTDAEYLKRAEINEIEPKDIVKQYGSWAVTRQGLDSLGLFYPLEAKQLSWDGLTAHMFEKRWVIKDHFSAALKAAREYHQC